jgi:hypothetical protein
MERPVNRIQADSAASILTEEKAGRKNRKKTELLYVSFKEDEENREEHFQTGGLMTFSDRR